VFASGSSASKKHEAVCVCTYPFQLEKYFLQFSDNFTLIFVLLFRFPAVYRTLKGAMVGMPMSI
jgi:hypothetical protein